MKKFGKSMLLCALLVWSACAWADGLLGVSFVLKSGGKVSFAFSERPSISTASDAVAVSVAGVERVSYPYSDVARVLFEDVETTGIAQPRQGDEACHAVFAFDGGRLAASGLGAGERVVVYSLSGRQAASLVAGVDGRASLQLSSLPQGVYLVRTQGGLSYKILNR